MSDNALFPTARLLQALHVTAARLFGPDLLYASDEDAILAALKMLLARETDGAGLFEAWTARLATQLAGLNETLALPSLAPDLATELASLRATLPATAPADAASRDRAEHRILSQWSSLAARLTQDPRLPPAARTQLVRSIAQAERQRTLERAGSAAPVAEVDTSITQERLLAYLADRFAEPGLKITLFRPLPGGFGKETTLFAVQSNNLSGEFVMRRDRLVPTMDNDCHRIASEYPVIRTAHAHGFPAPEALWLDTEHKLLPGGDFIIMRRAPGSSGGGVFGAAGKISADLTALLAQNVARLHNLPPLRELGHLSESITPELWDLPIAEVTRRYITSIRDMYLTELRTPSPAVLAMFGWLLGNVPKAEGRPVLLHGDIGFHNFILDEGRLTAVVDWEFAHIGDPAEDIGYIADTAGTTLDWDAFIKAYEAAGGAKISPERLRFFQVWGHLRNLAAAQITSQAFESGKLDELKLGHVGHSMTPMFLEAVMGVLNTP